MESRVNQIPGHNEAGSPGTNIEIKIKTMDSQTYTLQVDKQVPVPDLKEQIASVTGIVTDQQRLICRGRVLTDDKLLSAYHVEDGHTLHLVVRQPTQPSADNQATDPALGSRSQLYQVAPGVLVETFNMSGQGDRSLSDINPIVSAILSSIGITSAGNFSEVRTGQGSERLPARGDTTGATQQQTQQSGMSSDTLRPHVAFGASSPLSFGSLSTQAIPDALSTMSLYLSQLRHDYCSNDVADESGPEQTLPDPGNAQAGLPTPAALAELLVATREFLNQQTGDSLVQLTRQLENQAAETNPDTRSAIQSRALRTGMLFQNLGVFLLELGRTVMTLRLGQSPSEAVVNAGPGVFISPSGPNPLMVQPLPFQPGLSLGSSQVGASPTTGSGLGQGLAGGMLPRRIDIQIRRGSASRQSDPDGSQQQTSAQRDSSVVGNPATHTNQQATSSADLPSFGSSGGRSVRVLPLFRSMVAAVPDLNRAPSDLHGNISGLYHPLVGRLQNMTSRDVMGSVASARPAERNPTTERGSQAQNTEDPSEDGERASSTTRTIDINIYSSGGAQNNDVNLAEGQVPDSVMQLLRGLFTGGDIQVENVHAEGTANPVDTHAEPENTSGGGDAPQEATEATASEDAIFFSRMLQQIMPYISNVSCSGPNDAGTSDPGVAASSSAQPGQNSESGSSRRSGGVADEPKAKRHKLE